MKILESERIILRNWHVLDLEDFHQISSNKKVADLAGFRLKISKEDSSKNLEQFIAVSDDSVWGIELKNLDKLVFWAIELKELNKAIGWIELCEATCKPKEVGFKYVKEIGFVLAEEYWGQGLMSEAIKHVLNYLFNEEKINAVVCSHFINNTQSQKVIKKCGFKFYLEDNEEIYYYLVKDGIDKIR